MNRMARPLLCAVGMTHSAQSRRISAPLLLAALFSQLLAACGATYTTAHQAYAPLLDHAGQLDIGARAGVHEPGGAVTAAANAAYAPIDHLEIVAGVDYAGGEASGPTHIGGGVGIGTFARHDTLRLEARAGVEFGDASQADYGHWCTALSGPWCRSESWSLQGTYIAPMLQGMFGFEVRYFELAGGLRLQGRFDEMHVTRLDNGMPPVDVQYERLYAEPVIAIRVPLNFMRIELLAGLPVRVLGDTAPGADLPSEPDIQAYVAFGLGLQLDTVTPPAPEE